MNIIDKLLSLNPYSRPKESLQSVSKIVIHWVGNANTTAMANRNYFDNLKNQRGPKYTFASSHYIVGLSGEIIRCIPENEVAYHAGNGTMNRNSIGIETCHPDWEGKFNDLTYNSLVELVASLVEKYNLTINDIIRHYDITSKDCPRYYVKNNTAWVQFKNDVANKLNKSIEKEVEGDFNMAKTYKNGSTREDVYADTGLTLKTGSLDRYEQCECLDIVDGRYLVKYKVNGTNRYKTGFVKYSGGVK